MPIKKSPWERPTPKKKKPTKLSPAAKAEAKANAKRAGRPYPNLVDNMRAAAKSKGGAKKSSAGNSSSRKSTSKKTGKK